MLAISLFLRIKRPTSATAYSGDISLFASQLVRETFLGLWKLLIISNFSDFRLAKLKNNLLLQEFFFLTNFGGLSPSL
jgi:hypothetical protein